jgi:hypothetical protein
MVKRGCLGGISEIPLLYPWGIKREWYVCTGLITKNTIIFIGRKVHFVTEIVHYDYFPKQ